MLVLPEGVRRVPARSKPQLLEPYRPKAKRGVLTVEQKIRRAAKSWEDWVVITQEYGLASPNGGGSLRE